MMFLSVHRLAILLRVHFRLIVASALLCSFVSFLFGSITPYIFRSEAIIMLPQPKTIDAMQFQDNTDVVRVASLFRSSKVLMPVAKKQIEKLGTKANVLVPLAWSWFDIKQRLAIFRTKMFDAPGIPQKAPELDSTSAEIFSSLMVRQINTDPDAVMRTVKVTYDAADSEEARTTCELVIEEFINAVTEMEQQELQRQEQYLLGAIEQQLEAIKDTENKMRIIVERHPELSSATGDKGTNALAAKLIEKQDVLKKLEGEFQANRRFLDTIQGDISSVTQSREVTNKVSGELSAKIAEEISELEFKRMQYTQVSGYDDTHPEIQRIQTRIDSLRKVLSTPQGTKQNASSFKSLFQKKSQLNERNKALDAERDTVHTELAREEVKFKELVKKNFDLDSLMRNLNVNVSITAELYRELQKTRLIMAGARGKVNVLSPPSLPVHASNISVKRRAFFGFIIGIAAAFSLLILFDFFSPILLHEDDLTSFHEKVFGPFRNSDRGKHQLFAWFSSLRLEKARRENIAPLKIRFGLLGIRSAEQAWEPFVAGSLKEMKARGEKVGVIVVRDPEAWEERYDWRLGEDLAEELIIDDVPNQLAVRVAELEKKVDYIFIVLPENQTGIPVEPYVDEQVDHTLIVSLIGVSALKKVSRLSRVIENSSKKSHLVLSLFQTDRPIPLSKWFLKRGRGGRSRSSRYAA